MSFTIEPGSAVYEALKLVAAGRAVINSEGVIQSNPEQSTTEKEKASERIRRYKKSIEDEITRDYLNEQESFIDGARRSYLGIGYFPDFRIPNDFYFPKSCLYVAIGHPELAVQLLAELQSMDKRLRDAQVIEMAREGLPSRNIWELTNGRLYVHYEMFDINIALGNDETASEILLRIDKLQMVNRYASDSFSQNQKNLSNWIDEPNPEFYKAEIEWWNQNQNRRVRSQYYNEKLDNLLAKRKIDVQREIEYHKGGLQLLKSQSSATNLVVQ